MKGLKVAIIALEQHTSPQLLKVIKVLNDVHTSVQRLAHCVPSHYRLMRFVLKEVTDFGGAIGHICTPPRALSKFSDNFLSRLNRLTMTG
ncbi:hypothetical protein D3C73_819110 [compost metagenome]